MKTKWNLFHCAVVALSMLMTVSCSEDPEGDNGEADPDAGATTTSITVTLDSPAADAVDVSSSPTFEWSVDSDLSGITYDLYLGSDASSMWEEASSLSVTEYTPVSSFQLGSTQYWQVIASYDGTEYKSSVQSFTIEVFDAPTLVGPADNDTFGSEATFEWDAIDRDGITYILNFSEIDATPANDFTITVPTEDVEEYALTADDVALFTDGASYTWSVTATDGANSATSAESRTIRKIVAGAPSAPSITSPEANALIDMSTNSVTLEWTEAIDPEDDDVTYSIVVTKGTTTEIVATGITALEYSYDISGDADGTMYTWYVVATDGTYTSESLNSVFYRTDSTDVPLSINSLKTPGTLALAEAFVWEDAGDGFTYEVKLYKDGEWTSVVTDLTETTYTLKNSMIPCDLITGAVEFKVQIVATDGTDTRESAEVSFYPEMQGTFTDVRGTEVITYDWVRVGPLVWMQEGLKATRFNDGTALTDLDGLVTSNKTFFSNQTSEVFFDFSSGNHVYAPAGYAKLNIELWNGSTEDSAYTADTKNSLAYYDFFSGDAQTEYEDLLDASGYVYPFWTANDERIAPEGWHVPTRDELNDWCIYYGIITLWTDTDLTDDSDDSVTGIDKVKINGPTKLAPFWSTKYFNGTNTSGLNLTPSVQRNHTRWESGVSYHFIYKGRWQYQGHFWALHKDKIAAYDGLDPADCVTLAATADNSPAFHFFYSLEENMSTGDTSKGTMYYPFASSSASCVGIRCVMD